MIVWCLTLHVFRFSRGGQCTYPCFSVIFCSERLLQFCVKCNKTIHKHRSNTEVFCTETNTRMDTQTHGRTNRLIPVYPPKAFVLRGCKKETEKKKPKKLTTLKLARATLEHFADSVDQDQTAQTCSLILDLRCPIRKKKKKQINLEIDTFRFLTLYQTTKFWASQN